LFDTIIWMYIADTHLKSFLADAGLVSTKLSWYFALPAMQQFH